MPLIHAGGLRHYYRLEGQESRPVLMFSHSLGCDHTLWDEQTAAMLPHFRVLRYDTRGHGATDAPAGDYSIEMLARDALSIADALGIRQFAFCGLSLGGAIGQWLGANAPERVSALVLANTAARFTDPSVMENRRRTVIEHGMAAIADAVMGRFFTAESVAANPPAVASIRQVLLSTNVAGYAGCCSAIRDMDQVPLLPAIRAATLIVTGDHDVSTPWSGPGELLAREIRGAIVEHLPTAHLSNLERPRSFNAALLKFLLPKPADPLAAGFERRRAVLGDAHVDRAIAGTTEFTRAFQDLITRFAWGTVWQRPGLDDRTRRLLALTALGAAGRWDEFRMHVRSGLAHELEPCDLEETLLQLALYAGVPAANAGFHIASEETAKP
jgi:3-oxoadipate enol-lactonase/4-carboxymuconolactone decarboxylase